MVHLKLSTAATKTRAISCDLLESESATATTSASECSLGSDADAPLSVASSFRALSPTYEPIQALTSPLYAPSISSESQPKVGKHSSSGSKIKRSHSKDIKRTDSKEKSPKTKRKNSRPGSHIVPPLAPLPDPVKVAQNDEIARLKALLAEKDRIIEDQQRKMDSYALDATKSVISARPASPPSTSSPNLAASPASSPSTTKRSDVVIPVDQITPKPEVKKGNLTDQISIEKKNSCCIV